MKEIMNVSLTLTDFSCSPNEITEILGVTPTFSWLLGDVINPRSILVRKENGWRLDVPEDQDASLNDRVHRLKTVLGSRVENFRNLPADCSVELSCCVRLDGESPEFHLDKQAMIFLASIGAELDVDIYLHVS